MTNFTILKHKLFSYQREWERTSNKLKVHLPTPAQLIRQSLGLKSEGRCQSTTASSIFSNLDPEAWTFCPSSESIFDFYVSKLLDFKFCYGQAVSENLNRRVLFNYYCLVCCNMESARQAALFEPSKEIVIWPSPVKFFSTTFPTAVIEYS